MVAEINITIKGDESSYKQKFLVYEDFMMNEDDPIIQQYIKEALANAKILDPEIKIRSLLVIS